MQSDHSRELAKALKPVNGWMFGPDAEGYVHVTGCKGYGFDVPEQVIAFVLDAARVYAPELRYVDNDPFRQGVRMRFLDQPQES